MKHFLLITLATTLLLVSFVGLNYGFVGGGIAKAALNGAAGEACQTASSNPLCKPPGGTTNKDFPVLKTINKVTMLLSVVAGVTAVLYIIYGGLRFILSKGDPQGIANARGTVLYGVIGLVIIVVAQALISFVIGWITK